MPRKGFEAKESRSCEKGQREGKVFGTGKKGKRINGLGEQSVGGSGGGFLPTRVV
jgi:hypothetical protein